MTSKAVLWWKMDLLLSFARLDQARIDCNRTYKLSCKDAEGYLFVIDAIGSRNASFLHLLFLPLESRERGFSVIKMS